MYCIKWGQNASSNFFYSILKIWKHLIPSLGAVCSWLNMPRFQPILDQNLVKLFLVEWTL